MLQSAKCSCTHCCTQVCPLIFTDPVPVLSRLKDGSLSHRRRNLASAFRTHIINSPKETEALALQSPVRVMGSCSFMYMRHNDVYLLAVTKNNANVMLAFQFMTQVRTHSLKPCH